MSDIKDDGKFYSNDEAQAMITNFQTAHPGVNQAGVRYGINKLTSLTTAASQGTVDGINVYFGQNNGEDTIVIYAADANGNNIDSSSALVLQGGIKIPK